MGNTLITAVTELDKSKYKTKIFAGGHLIYADEPNELGGTDEGMTPNALLLASLGSCTAITIRMYADRKEIPLEGIVVNLAINEKDDSYEGIIISRKIEFKGELTEQQIKRLLVIADKCPVHKILTNPIKIETS